MTHADLFGHATLSSSQLDDEVARRALDDLFVNARQYRSSDAYWELMRFVTRFRMYAPFNAVLIHAQMTGAKYVAPAYRWRRDYLRSIKTGARPIVILQPMGPVMFVFDVAETEPLPGAPPLPTEVVNPFEVRRGQIGGQLPATIANARRDGISTIETSQGTQGAGSIQWSEPGNELDVVVRIRPSTEFRRVPRRYDLVLNSNLSLSARYATLVHELAHLYCGHLGTPNERWWPDRSNLGLNEREFEAESVCYLVCARLGIVNPSETYLSGYLGDHREVPPISLECVLKAAGLIELMGRGRLPLRKTKE